MPPQTEDIIARAKRLAADAGLDIGSEHRFPYTYHHDDLRMRLNAGSRADAASLLRQWSSRSSAENPDVASQYRACLVAIRSLLEDQFGAGAAAWLEDATSNSRRGLAAFVEEAELHVSQLVDFDTFVKQKLAMRSDTIRESVERLDELLKGVGASGGFCAIHAPYGEKTYLVGLPRGDGWRVCEGKVLKAVLDYFEDEDVRSDFDVGRSDFSDEVQALASIRRRFDGRSDEDVEFLVDSRSTSRHARRP